jgi:hypothetical protein
MTSNWKKDLDGLRYRPFYKKLAARALQGPMLRPEGFEPIHKQPVMITWLVPKRRFGALEKL